VYAPGTRPKAYAEDCVDKYGVRDRSRLGTRVVGANFDEQANAWRLETAAGERISARFVIGATGVFSQPKPPEIPGVEGFAGPTMHTARWDHSVDVRGKRVAVIGTGASAIQVIPAIAPEVAQLTVFQRTPIWCLPPDAPLSLALAVLRCRAELFARWVSQARRGDVRARRPLRRHLPSLRAREDAARKMLREVKGSRGARQVDVALRPRLRPELPQQYIRTFNRAPTPAETAAIEEIRQTVCGPPKSSIRSTWVIPARLQVFDRATAAVSDARRRRRRAEQWWDSNRMTYEA
jgi:cation diffusion facilitator CzcD-associated flavoprotein CzcO